MAGALRRPLAEFRIPAGVSGYRAVMRIHPPYLRRLRGLMAALLIVALLGSLSGCISVPDGLVARRADGLVARSLCPPGAIPQISAVEVFEGEGDGSWTGAEAHPKPGTFLWSASPWIGFVSEIQLFAPDWRLRIEESAELATMTDDTPLQVVIHSRAGTLVVPVRRDALEIGEATGSVTDRDGGPVREAELSTPSHLSCFGLF